MKCYVDAKSGEEKDAVAVCGICGMGLCGEHAHERLAPRELGGRGGHVAWHGDAPMLILCPYCSENLRA